MGTDKEKNYIPEKPRDIVDGPIVDRESAKQKANEIKLEEVFTTIKEAFDDMHDVNPALMTNELFAQISKMDSRIVSVFSNIIWDMPKLSQAGTKKFNEMITSHQCPLLIQRMISNVRIIDHAATLKAPKDVLDQLYIATANLDEISDPDSFQAKPDEVSIRITIPGKNLLEWRVRNGVSISSTSIPISKNWGRTLAEEEWGKEWNVDRLVRISDTVLKHMGDDNPGLNIDGLREQMDTKMRGEFDNVTWDLPKLTPAGIAKFNEMIDKSQGQKLVELMHNNMNLINMATTDEGSPELLSRIYSSMANMKQISGSDAEEIYQNVPHGK